MRAINLLIISLIFIIRECSSQGAPWTAEEMEIIREKVEKVITKGGKVMNQLKKLHPELVYAKSTAPGGPKLLRLGFHDCLTYQDGAPEEGFNGCDGCLNSNLIGLNLVEEFDAPKGSFNAPDFNTTSNNGLLYVADILEEIYTNPKFPKKTTPLEASMKDSGKSRADLWAFATLVAAELGVVNNNLACEDTGEAFKTCGHIRQGEDDCEMKMPRSFVFRTGRKDCVPEGDQDRAFLTSRQEIHPDSHGNGKQTVDFYRENFGLSAREGIALTGGAHSVGKSRRINSFFNYPWTRTQTQILNNQLFKHYAGRPQYYSICKDGEWHLLGNSEGEPANTSWKVRSVRHSEGGGPYQWFHIYERCTVNCFEENDSECCANLEPGMHCQPECVKNKLRMETALPAEMGFYWKFESDPVTGRPSGCPGFDHSKFASGKKKSANVDCEMEDYAPEGVALSDIVEEFADDAEGWMEVFVPTLEKMLANGYSDDDLVDGPTF